MLSYCISWSPKRGCQGEAAGASLITMLLDQRDRSNPRCFWWSRLYEFKERDSGKLVWWRRAQEEDSIWVAKWLSSCKDNLTSRQFLHMLWSESTRNRKLCARSLYDRYPWMDPRWRFILLLSGGVQSIKLTWFHLFLRRVTPCHRGLPLYVKELPSLGVGKELPKMY